MKVKCILNNITDIQTQGSRFATAIAYFYDDDTDTMLPGVLDVDIPLSMFKNQPSFQSAIKTLTVERAVSLGYTITSQDITSLI